MDYASILAQYANIAEQKGIVNALEGNLSLFDRDNGRYYVTPSGRMKLTLTPQDICVLDTDGRLLSGGKPTSEFLLHEAVYQTRPDAGAVIHCHVPYLTAYALRYRDFIPPQDCFLGTMFPRIICLPYGRHGTHEIHQGIEKALENSPICLLGGHGVVCCDKDMMACLGVLEGLENLAKTVDIAKRI